MPLEIQIASLKAKAYLFSAASQCSIAQEIIKKPVKYHSQSVVMCWN